MGEGWQSAVHPDDLPEVLEHWRRSLDTGEPYEGEYRIRNAEGRYEWFLSRAIPDSGSDRTHRALVRHKHQHR